MARPMVSAKVCKQGCGCGRDQRGRGHSTAVAHGKQQLVTGQQAQCRGRAAGSGQAITHGKTGAQGHGRSLGGAGRGYAPSPPPPCRQRHYPGPPPSCGRRGGLQRRAGAAGERASGCQGCAFRAGRRSGRAGWQARYGWQARLRGGGCLPSTQAQQGAGLQRPPLHNTRGAQGDQGSPSGAGWARKAESWGAGGWNEALARRAATLTGAGLAQRPGLRLQSPQGSQPQARRPGEHLNGQQTSHREFVVALTGQRCQEQHAHEELGVHLVGRRSSRQEAQTTRRSGRGGTGGGFVVRATPLQRPSGILRRKAC